MVRKVLIIANCSAAAAACEQTLAAEGCEVRSFCDPAEACRHAATGEVEAALVVQAGAAQESLAALHQIKEARPSMPVVVLSGSPTVEDAVAAMKEGAADYLLEPCSAEELFAAFARVDGQPASEPAATGPLVEFEGMLGQCAVMRDVFALIRRVAPTDTTVLVCGESGTGKEMVVRALHHLSRRRDCPLLACDCTALAPTLLESELFGHVKGSFSGAIATKLGLFEVAHRGTLFLDEVANLSMETQGKLLRVLESRRVRKVGDTADHEVDIRLIAATNRSLGELVKTGAFRADLYYRLNVLPITLPPLRERPGDLPLLAATFLEGFSRQMGVEPRGFARDTLAQMELYHWPGNVRELRNIVERLSVLYGGVEIAPEHLPWDLRAVHPAVSAADTPRSWEDFKNLKRKLVDELERRFLITALDRCSQNVTLAAEAVGMQRPNFHALLRAHGLKPERRQ